VPVIYQQIAKAANVVWYTESFAHINKIQGLASGRRDLGHRENLFPRVPSTASNRFGRDSSDLVLLGGWSCSDRSSDRERKNQLGEVHLVGVERAFGKNFSVFKFALNR
jgi:hypothetical protein